MLPMILSLALVISLYAGVEQSPPQASSVKQDNHTLQEAAVYKRYSLKENTSYLIMVPEGNGYRLNGVYQLKDKASTSHWKAACTPKTDVTFDYRYVHDMGDTESGYFSLNFQDDGGLSLEVQGTYGHKRNPVYNRFLQK